MQAKDIPEVPVLKFLAELAPKRCNWFTEDSGEPYPNSVLVAMPSETPPKVGLAKMRSSIKRGLVDGCPCGCRGDFTITAFGRALINQVTPADQVREGRGK